MYKFTPTRYFVGGDKTAAKGLTGQANSQMEILKSQMAFQNLKQGVRRLWLNEDTHVECAINHGIQSCRIWVRPITTETAETSGSPVKFVIKPTFNGHPAIKGRQHIVAAYNGEYKWLQVYGTENEPPDTSANGYTDVLEFDSEEDAASFRANAVFFLRARMPDYDADRATFAHFYNVDTDPEYDPASGGPAPTKKEHWEVSVGTGDGTTTPQIYSIPFLEYGFSVHNSDYIVLTTTRDNGEDMTAYFDFDGFPLSSSVVNGQLNVLTREWDIPVEWKYPVQDGAAIMMDFWARGYADYSYPLSETQYDTQFMRQVNFKEADGKLGDVGPTLIEAKDGVEILSYDLAFSGLKIMMREPNSVAAQNETCGCVGGYFSDKAPFPYFSGRITQTTYGSIPQTNFNYYNMNPDALLPTAGSYYAGEVYNEVPLLCADGETTENHHCQNQYKYQNVKGISDYTFLGIISDPDGRNPQADSFYIEVHYWPSWLGHKNWCNDIGGGCERPFEDDSATYDNEYGYLPEDACCIKELRWDYSMVATPAEAF